MTPREQHLAALASLPPATAADDRLIPIARVEQIAGIKRSRIYQLIRAEDFPAPYKPGGYGSRWSEAEVRDWLEQVKARADAIPARIKPVTPMPGTTIVWTPGASRALPIHDGGDEDTPCMTACWEPSPADLAVLNAGGEVYLRITGQGHPPVVVYALGPKRRAA